MSDELVQCLAAKTMSLQQTAYIDRVLVPQLDALQAAVDALAFDCKLDGSYMPFKSKGFLPCFLNGKVTGFEIYFESSAEVLTQFPDLTATVGSHDVAITFRWAGDMAECASVLIVSAALAKSFGAIVHYQDDNMLYSVEQLIEEARIALNSI